MANRSYLYSTNTIPGPDVSPDERELTGISEQNYDIPLVYKILLSGNPRKCKSSIWDTPEDIAIVGNYDAGVERLSEFLDRICHPDAEPLKTEALDFLAMGTNRNNYFVLECGEIFDMEDEPLSEQTGRLLAEIQNLDAEMKSALSRVMAHFPIPSPNRGLLASLFNRNPPTIHYQDQFRDAVMSLGLGYWSNVLYYDFSRS